ncbi:hypothetical protein BDY21DRAFT_100985 [Lineolata rhizophorae]|uniref:Uncharacterized protein n=1 Tax=Lineolata rhizophorae TaxID=578093 RepID=A0A6A6NSC1_9PEZI|nr:hypothetical protein BDY21DRAFT_100985 [Lineolata rhizophorae]
MQSLLRTDPAAWRAIRAEQRRDQKRRQRERRIQETGTVSLIGRPRTRPPPPPRRSQPRCHGMTTRLQASSMQAEHKAPVSSPQLPVTGARTSRQSSSRQYMEARAGEERYTSPRNRTHSSRISEASPAHSGHYTPNNNVHHTPNDNVHHTPNDNGGEDPMLVDNTEEDPPSVDDYDMTSPPLADDNGEDWVSAEDNGDEEGLREPPAREVVFELVVDIIYGSSSP